MASVGWFPTVGLCLLLWIIATVNSASQHSAVGSQARAYGHSYRRLDYGTFTNTTDSKEKARQHQKSLIRKKRFLVDTIVDAVEDLVCLTTQIVLNGECVDPVPECNGKTTDNGGCQETYPNSHLIDMNGNRVTAAGGRCDTDNVCTCPNDGFYSNGGQCSLCKDIVHCNFETCTTANNAVCSLCEGVVIDVIGFRAFKMSSNKKACDRTCSWRTGSGTQQCYPGTCPTELATSCTCSSGFGGDHCRTIKDKPEIKFNSMMLTKHGENEFFPPDRNSGPSSTQSDVWTNTVDPDSVTYEFKSLFQRTMPSPFPAYIKKATVGIVSAKAKIQLKNSAGQTQGRTVTKTCTGVSVASPDTDIFDCKAELSMSAWQNYLPTPFDHLDRLEYTFTTNAGGYVTVEDKENNNKQTKSYFTQSSTEHAFTIHFDTVKPYNCLTSCGKSPLTLTEIVTKNTFSITWDGWADTNAGLDQFGYRVHGLQRQTVNSKLEYQPMDTHDTIDISTASGSASVTLSGSPGLYAVILDAYDRANNIRSARQFVLYDDGSKITAVASQPFRVTSASSVTSYTWQNTLGAISVTWTGRYTNVFHDLNHVLDAVLDDADVDSAYDDTDGDFTVSAYTNVNGIVKFTVAYAKDSQGGTTLSTPADSKFTKEPDLTATRTYQADVKDGETLTLWVRAYDIRDEYLEENVTIHVDSSVPELLNLWLTKDHLLNLSVHSLAELSDMTIEWEAYDLHSGLKEVQWRVFDKYYGRDVVHGHQFVQAQKQADLSSCKSYYASHDRGADCYCTGPVECYHSRFQVKNPLTVDSTVYGHGGIFSDKDTGVHDYDYWLEVTVFNHANLSSTIQKQITIDLTPPHPGAVHDGKTGSSEVDHQSGKELHAYWSGFFDRESGVRSYQYAFDTDCVPASAFGHTTTDSRVKDTYETYTSWTAPADGKYHVTVVAINNAIDVSDPVCSDGVVIDSTPPATSSFYIASARIAGGVLSGSSQDEVWFLGADRRRRRVENPDQACITAASGVDTPYADFAPSPIEAPIPSNQACPQGALDSGFYGKFFLAQSRMLFVNWTGDDVESGIHDYEVGIATTSTTESPDVSSYESTHHHPFYQKYHPVLAEGRTYYILVKAINKAGLEKVKALGPMQLVRGPPSYSGAVTLELKDDTLLVAWDNGLFTDVEPSLLSFTVALEETSGGAVIHPHVAPATSSSHACTSTSPPSCATFDPQLLKWGLHERHQYVAKVMVTSVVALTLHLTSAPYVHDTRLAAAGTVFDAVPEGEEVTLGIERSEDTDYQMDTTTLAARWSGFEDGSQKVSYKVGLGINRGSDDVIGFKDVGFSTEYVFTNLALQVDQKYHVTVVATTDGGDRTAVSDGVSVIQVDTAPDSTLALKDGAGTATTENKAWSPEHHADMTSAVSQDDVSFQSSTTTLWGHWDMTSEQRQRYPDVQYQVQRNMPGTNVWLEVTTYASSPLNDAIQAAGLALEAGQRYRLAVKFCVFRACTQPAFTSGVYVITSPPLAGALAVVHSNSSGKSELSVTMERFRDGDIPTLAAAQSALSGYQWSLSHRLASGNRPTLTPWQALPALAPVNDTHVHFSLSLDGELSFHKCLVLTVRGVNHEGMSSLASADVADCTAVEDNPITPRDVLDAVGTRVSGSSFNITPVTMDFNGKWTKGDRDYTPYSTVLSAVWPLLRHTNVTWAVLASPSGGDVTSHYLDPAFQAPQDPCASLLQIACGEVTDQKYINVEFGPGTSRPSLTHGHHYYFCIFAQVKNSSYEHWTKTHFELTSCSDGVTVDMTSPQPGSVWVDGLRNGMYQTSLTALKLQWSGFKDVEELGSSGHHSGILSYQVAVGSVAGGEDVLKFRDVGLVNALTLHALNMQNGHVYYATVQATDHVGRTAVSSSSAFVVDVTPPQQTDVIFRFDEPFITSSSVFSLCWTDTFVDLESDVDHYEVSAGSRPGHMDILLGQSVSGDCGHFTTDQPMGDGHAYFVNVRAVNRAGLGTTVSSSPVVVMTTDPAPGIVYDGPPPAAGADPRDVDFVATPDDVVAFWSGFSTPLAPVTSYSVRLGTCSGCDDVIADFDVGLSTRVTWSHAPLRHDLRYYTTVTACNAVDKCTEVTSDGVMIDVTPPVTGIVWDGTGGEDIAFQHQGDFLGAEWRGFTDLGSGLAHFSWKAGTSSGGSDVMPERQLGLVYSAYTTDLAASLPGGRTIYVTVTAFDAAGNSRQATSNGFRVDSSGPVFNLQPRLHPGVATLDNAGFVSRDMLAVQWSAKDDQSGVATHHLSVHSHLNGEFLAARAQVPGPLTRYTFSQLTLHDGSVYRVKLTACNLATVCTTAVSEDILHDNSPPTTGMFAVYTAHSAKLGRHEGATMQWTSSSLTLSWVGFHDQHSGIDRYLVSVGTTPFAHDLNKDGAPGTVTHTTASGTVYEDEGYVQTYSVMTTSLVYGQQVYVTVIAVNGVGLRSHPTMSLFKLEEGNSMFLIRRCSSFSCLGHCACATQGGSCGTSTPCTDLTTGVNPNHLLTVTDHYDLSVLEAGSSVSDLFQPSQSYLAATWQVTTSQGLQPIRYEVSAGVSDKTSPEGVFNLVEDRIWRDVGLETFSVITLPTDRTLLTRKRYSTFVRAWYGDGSYAVFRSGGITPVTTNPTTTNQAGRAVKEHLTSTDTKDVDFVTSKNSIYVSWSGKFVSSSDSLQGFHVYVSTTPEASNVYSSAELSKNALSHHLTGLGLEEDVLYFTTVVARGPGGLTSWDVSDGFSVDVTRPVAGVIMDGSGQEDRAFQWESSEVSARWHGFSDTASGIRRYTWCVGTTADTTTCDVMAWTDVGLMTSATASLSSSVQHGTTLFAKVFAEDAAGHRSEVKVTDGVTVDTKAPGLEGVVYSGGINRLDNPSFELDAARNLNLSQCDPQPPTAWTLSTGSCLTLHSPPHALSVHGSQHAVLSGTLSQTATGLTQGGVYRLAMRLSHPHNALANQRPVSGHVTMGHQVTPFQLDPSMCKGLCDAGQEPMMVWQRLNFAHVAESTTMDISISTTAISSGDQVAIDDVSLTEVVLDPGDPTDPEEPALPTLGHFLSEWSRVEAAWFFRPHLSPVVECQWAVGTSRGGIQLQGFTSVGRRQQAALSGLTLTPMTSVHVTVLATNAAGLSTLAHSRPLMVDTSPPDIAQVLDGDSGDEVDFQTSSAVSGRWSVSDQQSSVDRCQWAVGTVAGRGDVLQFQNVAPVSAANGNINYNVSSDVTSALSALGLSRPVKLFVSVRCFNYAGLPASAASNGVTLVTGGADTQTPVPRLLPDSVTQYPVRESCHVHLDRLRLRWDNVPQEVPVKGYEISWESGNTTGNSTVTPSFPYLLEAADLTLGVDQLLLAGRQYNLSVNPQNVLGNFSSGTAQLFTVKPDPPTVNAAQTVTASVSGKELTLDWAGLFSSPSHSPHPLGYELTLGSVQGGGDILLLHPSSLPRTSVSLVRARASAFNVSLVLTAIDACGQFVTHMQTVHVTLP